MRSAIWNKKNDSLQKWRHGLFHAWRRPRVSPVGKSPASDQGSLPSSLMDWIASGKHRGKP